MIRAVAHGALAALAAGVMACVPACATSDTKAVSGRQLKVREAPPPAPRQSPATPQGFVTMTVLGVLPVGEAHAVFLVDARQEVVLPIVIGESEAISIELRLHHRRFARPLTHDLLDAVVKDLGGRILEVRVDGVSGGSFVGSLLLTHGDKVVKVDARPSDAIALAVGDGAPIFVAQKVLAEAGIDRRTLDRLAMPPDDGDDAAPDPDPGPSIETPRRAPPPAYPDPI